MRTFREQLLEPLDTSKLKDPNNQYYDDETWNNTKTADLNTAYKILQKGCQNPKELADSLQESNPLESKSLLPTSTLTLIKRILSGDHGDQYLNTSDFDENIKTSQIFLNTCLQNPDILPLSLWEKTEQFTLPQGINPRQLEDLDYVTYHMAQKPLSRIVGEKVCDMLTHYEETYNTLHALLLGKALKMFSSFQETIPRYLVQENSFTQNLDPSLPFSEKERTIASILPLLLNKNPTKNDLHTIKSKNFPLRQHILAYHLTGNSFDETIERGLQTAIKKIQTLKTLQTRTEPPIAFP